MHLEELLTEIAAQERDFPIPDALGRMVWACTEELFELQEEDLLKVTAARGEENTAAELRILKNIRKK